MTTTTRCLWLLPVVAACLQAAAQERSVVAHRVEQAPTLSTRYDETWRGAARVSEFRQREPFEGRHATERTEVFIAYDKRTLYFYVHCFDRHAKEVVASELRRDGDYAADDNFTILISPRNDRRNGYTFTVNPLGTQFDALVGDEGRVNDPNWDGIWRSEARVVEDGWVATIAIPFSTLNFKAAENPALGVNFRRFIRRKNEEDLWRSYLRIDGLMRISEAGELDGIGDIGSGRLLVIKPYVLGGVRANDVDGTRMLHSGGGDVKFGITSQLVLNATVNTDFADAEVDPLRLNLTPFKVFLPEKRPFFLENSGVFLFGDGQNSGIAANTQLFFSRQIGIDPVSGRQVPVDGGVKLTGTTGDFDLGFLDVHTRSSELTKAANYAVARIKRKLWSESYIGAIGVDKETGGADSFNRAAGLDANVILWKKLNVYAYYARTFSPVSTVSGGGNAAYSVDGSYTSNLVQAQFQHSVVQPNFNPEVGFTDRTDIRTDFADVNLSPRPHSGPVREYDFEAFISHQPNTAGVLQTQEWQTTFRAQFHNGSYTDDDLFDNFVQRLNEPFNVFKNVFIPAGVYRYSRHQFTYGSDKSKRFVYSFFERFGTYYNGHLNEFRIRESYRPTVKFAISGSETWDRFRFPQGTFNIYVGDVTVSYSFNRFLTTSLLVQHNTADEHPVNVNARLRYTFHPDSDLFVIYNFGSQFASIAAGNPTLTLEKRLTVKLTYSFVR